jgi:hypothetical protein
MASLIRHYQRLTGEVLEDADEMQSEMQPGGVTWLQPLVDSNAFTVITLGLLGGNLVVMCMPYAGQSDEYADCICDDL